MTQKNTPPLPSGTAVTFDIAQGAAVGEGIIRDADNDDGWLYRLDVVSGDRADGHRNADGELWVCEFEVESRG
jgi:hypothetical protein